MSKETILKLHEHLKEVASGKIKTGNAVKDELIISDAKRHLEELENKTFKSAMCPSSLIGQKAFPFLTGEAPKKNILEKVAEAKKGKK